MMIEWRYVIARGLFLGGLLGAAAVMHAASGLLSAMVGVALSLNISLVGFLVALSARGRTNERDTQASHGAIEADLMSGLASSHNIRSH